jgi:hypothetical protein
MIRREPQLRVSAEAAPASAEFPVDRLRRHRLLNPGAEAA